MCVRVCVCVCMWVLQARRGRDARVGAGGWGAGVGLARLATHSHTHLPAAWVVHTRMCVCLCMCVCVCVCACVRVCACRLQLWTGSPAKKLRNLTEGEMAYLRNFAQITSDVRGGWCAGGVVDGRPRAWRGVARWVWGGGGGAVQVPVPLRVVPCRSVPMTHREGGGTAPRWTCLPVPCSGAL